MSLVYAPFAKQPQSLTTNVVRTLGNSTYEDLGRSIDSDLQGNIYLTGQTAAYDISNPSLIISKYNALGILVWKRVIRASSIQIRGYDIAVDSVTNGVYVVGQVVDGSTYYILLVKYDFDGNVLWQRTLSGNQIKGTGVSVDSTGSVYIVGNVQISGYPYGVVAKYNSLGVLQWQRSLGNGADGIIFNGIDASYFGQINIVGTIQKYSPSNTSILAISYYPWGSVYWQKRAYHNTGIVNAFKGVTTSSGDFHVAGYTSNIPGAGNGVSMLMLRFDSPGNLNHVNVFTRDEGASEEYMWDIALDRNDGSLYYIGSASDPSNLYGTINEAQVIKISAAYSPLWQRSLGRIDRSDVFLGACINAAGKLCLTGHAYRGAEMDALSVILQPDGSGIGTYGLYTYRGSYLGGPPGGFSINGPSTSYSSNSSSFTSSSASYTSEEPSPAIGIEDILHSFIP